MFKSSTATIGLVILMLAADASCLQQQQVQQQPAPAAPPAARGVPSSLSNPLAGSDDGAKSNWPLVNVDAQNNKSTVGVHVPIFFDMINQADKDTGKSKLDLSVLQGLVTVNKDKAPDGNGQVSGPVKVTVFGIPVYSGRGVSGRGAADLDNSINTRRTRLAAEDAAASLTSRVQKINERMMNNLSDLLDRFSSNLKRATSSSASLADRIAAQRAEPSPVQSQAGQKLMPTNPVASLLDESREDRRSALESRAA